MGGLKKLFGGGAAQVEVAPTPQAAQTEDTSADVENSSTKKKKRSGFTSTQSNTMLTSSNEETGRQTLG